MLSAPMAVVIFFAISGFYMDLVLRTKYEASRAGTFLFWSNRLLRLFPAYWTVLVATVAVYGTLVAIGAPPLAATFKANFPWLGTHALATLSPWSLLFLGFSNIAILFQDVTLFQTVTANGSLHFTTSSIAASNLPAEKFLLVPQAWSISLELMFYALAPWLLRRRSTVLVALVAGSLVLRLLLDTVGLRHDPWSYRFFPTELAAFGAGALAHRLSERTRGGSAPRWLGAIGLAAAALLIIFNGGVENLLHRARLAGAVLQGSTLAHGLAFGAVVASMPFVFELSKRSRMDALLGDLSYPLYLVHLAVIQVGMITAQVYAAHLEWLARRGTPYLALIALAVSFGIVFAVERPVDQRRQRRVWKADSEAVGVTELAKAAT